MQRQRQVIDGGTITTSTDGRIAEIIIDRSAAPEHVLDAMDLVRVLIADGVVAAKVIKLEPATGEPAINVAHNTKEIL